ncbi:MAG: type II toxin-antitoxin system VapC family toxin [Actinomycetota bacterium]|nr:type II toxin-antitoxin system VapC family toxin [Actinomycetota bacterium]
MIFIDSNVPMYLVGADHPHKDDAMRLLDDLIVKGEKLVTDVEVLQEILHRYSAIGRLDAVQPAFDVITDVVDEVLPVHLGDVEEAKNVLLGRQGISARDSIHIAVMKSNKIKRIVSFDEGFDHIPGIERLS